MATIEIGQPNKKISYLNLSKQGVKYSTQDHDDVCEINMTFHNNPWLQKQDDYLCTISRFCVPMHQVPVIAAMPAAIQIWSIAPEFDGFDMRYGWADTLDHTHEHGDIHGNVDPHTGLHDGYNVNHIPQDGDTAINSWSTFFHINEGFEHGHAQSADPLVNLGRRPSGAMAEFDLPACMTTYEFLRVLRSKLNNYYMHFGNVNGNGAPVETNLGEEMRITLSPDYRFCLSLSENFINRYYVRLSPAFFRMAGFRQAFNLDDEAGHDFNYTWPMIDLPQRTFIFVTDFNDIEDAQQILPMLSNETDNVGNVKVFAVFDGQASVADNLNRIKRLVFSSSMQVKSEANTTSTYRRFLLDFLIENPTAISYPLNDKRVWPTIEATNVTEELPSHRIYTATNESGGRFQELTSPAPLYNITVKCHAEVWDFAADDPSQATKMITIPVSAGQMFSCKLVFVSKNDGIDHPDLREQNHHPVTH